ncbi:hypothetical protein BHM03_00012486 [Ensete ventricosum]|nr:hypothetical protein BHM03_00012486 [Ensete ventricosum]
MVAPTPNRYWRLFNNPGFTPPALNPGPPAVSAEVFLSFTQQVQTLAGMVQTILTEVVFHLILRLPRQRIRAQFHGELPSKTNGHVTPWLPAGKR